MTSLHFMHISDLHFGSKITNNQFGPVSGYHGHDFLLCRGLMISTRRLAAKTKAGKNGMQFVMSGDMTATGTASEFAVGHSFLKSEWRVRDSNPGARIGLRCSKSQYLSIPGNHDHWDGRTLPAGAYNPGILGRHFEQTPWCEIWTSPSGAILLEIYGIDSNSGQFINYRSLWAAGTISNDEFNDLETLLKKSDQKQPGQGVRRVRMIICHHSIGFGGGQLARVFGARGLDASSKRRLFDIAAQYEITAVLTGHTHDPFYKAFDIPLDKPMREIHEIRCPTTLQGPAGKGGAGFLLHNLHLQKNGDLQWIATPYMWNKGNRFVKSPIDLADFII